MDYQWEQLICEYFGEACKAGLEKYFQTHGFAAETTGIGGVIFWRDGVFVEVSYVPETAPKYSPTVVIGIGKSVDKAAKFMASVPAWALLTCDTNARGYSLWEFGSETELISVLKKIEDEIVEKYLRPLWEDRDSLIGAIENFRSRSME